MWKMVLRWLVVVAPLLTINGSTAFSQDFDAAANQFAKKIMERAAAPAPFSVSVKNRSSLSPQSVSTIRGALSRQFQAQGWKLKKAEDADVLIDITLSENLRSLVWTAELVQGSSRELVFYEFPSRTSETNVALGPHMTLAHTLLVSAENPLLDATLLEARPSEGAHLLVLEPSAVRLYMLQSSRWQLMQSQSLGREPVSTRDLRGRIISSSGSFDAFLPGLHCTGAITTAFSVTCRESDDPWPISEDRRMLAFYAANRNYFSGVLSGENGHSSNVEPFYSAALLNSSVVVVYAGLDGHARVVQASRRPVVLNQKWGSEFAALRSACDSSELLLATHPSDFTQPDALQAYRLVESDVVPAAEPVTFTGPVMSLKTSADHQQVIAIVGAPSGRYEAYLITAHCGT